MLAQGGARLCERNPGTQTRNNPKPRRGDRNLRGSFCRPSGASFHFVYVSQGLLALLAAPWANIGRPFGAENPGVIELATFGDL
jgi:hypothetical protein